ncbi:MAG: DNA polymerase III subunit delta [Chthonomonadales bacterium]|nr:DNA polymerase III subunit delta [Chthonomonadales bacterium]
MSDIMLTAASHEDWLAELHRAYIIYGEDADLIREAVGMLKLHVLGSAGGDFDWEELDAGSCSPEDVLASAQRVPVMADRRVVLVQGAEVYAKAERRAEASRLAGAVPNLPAASCLVFVVRQSDASRRRSAVLTPDLDGAVRAAGRIVRCAQLEGPALAEWAQAYVGRFGKSIARAAVQRVVADVAERHAVKEELDKLVAYVGDRDTIDISDVRELIGEAPEDVMFRLVDAVSARNGSDALVLLRQAARYEGRAQTLAAKLIALLTRQFRLLLQARELVEMGVPIQRMRRLPADVEAELPGETSLASMAWKAGAIARDADGWTVEEIADALGQLVECDAANKGEEAGSSDPMANLEMLVVTLCRKRPSLAARSA